MDTNTQPVVPTLAAVTSLATVATFAAFRNDVAGEEFSFIRPYDAKGSTNKMEGYRHAVIRYRNVDKPGTIQKAAQMVTIPQVTMREDLAIIASAKEGTVILGIIEDAEDDIIRGLIEAKAQYVKWNDVGWEKALDFLTAERVSQRLTKEQIEAWFLVAGVPFCTKRAEQICEAKGIKGDAVAKQVAGTLEAYKVNMMKLAAPIPNLGEQTATALHNMLLTAELDDDMAKVLKTKLHAILHPTVTENTDL